MTELAQKIKEATDAISKRSKIKPDYAIILGTGLGGLAEKIEAETIIPYADIPHFPEPTVATHAGQVVMGRISGKKVIAFQGRFHYYEGFTPAQITLNVRAAKALGAHTLIVSNAGGGMNPQYACGDIMVIEDHINLMGINPLIGPNDDSLGPRFPDMSQPYTKPLVKLAREVALENNIKTQQGVYVAVTGPNLETRAEYRFLRGIGADVVGMSTIPEVIVAVHSSMKVLGLSIVTDMCLPDALKPADINEIIKIANEADAKLTTLVQKVLERL